MTLALVKPLPRPLDELRLARRRLRNLTHKPVTSPLGWSKHMRVIGTAAQAYWDKQK